MIAAIRGWLYNRKARAQASVQGASSKPTINRNQRVAILTSTDTNSKTIDQFIRELEHSGKTVCRLHFDDSKVEEPPANTFSAKQLNWYGWPESDAVTEWLDADYDIMIIGTHASTAILHTLARIGQADLKVGPTSYLDEVDLIIDHTDQESTAALLQRIKRTIQQLSAA